MKKGFTLLELMIALFLISTLLLSTYPTWSKLGRQRILEKEQQKLALFLRQLQSRAANSQQVWFLIASRDLLHKRWCLTAQVKSEQLCDCLSPQHCPPDMSAQFYYPHFSNKTMINTKHYFPFEITRLSGIRDTLSTACFTLSSDKEKVVFSLFNVGSIKVKRLKGSGACENEGED
ncbi:TPA: type II secretion system protein [Pasteurella multocida]|nr:type II secretion system protein [Pasteurella multocida]